MTARGDIELLKQAENLSRQAIEKRRTSPTVTREFGVAKLLQGDFDERRGDGSGGSAGAALRDVIADHADTLVHCSRPGMALQKIERAIELQPLTPEACISGRPPAPITRSANSRHRSIISAR